MMGSDDVRWRAKVAAFVHDPPEKALVLLRGKGHERGTVSTLCRRLFDADAIPGDVDAAVRKADRWAAAADRPDRPRTERRFAAWDVVRFPEQPVLVHPLSGQRYELDRLDVPVEHAEHLASAHMGDLVGDNGELRAVFHRLWRLGPEVDARDIKHVWQLLPADTRVPDHAIWEHLGLVSALAGVFATGDRPALLAVSLGPVQDFIAQARSTSDLWAGSHLLSAMAWEAMKPLCEELGPDAVLFPTLRGVPLVDLWLEEQGLVSFNDPRWKKAASDANPLFGASLPNRFLAIVPESAVDRLAGRVTEAVRGWTRDEARKAWDRIAQVAEVGDSPDHALHQIDAQITGFPEVHWAAAPWSEEPDALAQALARMHGGSGHGFFGSRAWEALQGELPVTNREGKQLSFWAPNPGVHYPAAYDLVDRGLAAAKATRPFDPLDQEGYRCSLCGEREWLTATPECVRNPRGEIQQDDPWHRVVERRPAWARGTEHLCAVCTLKRLWPTLFSDRIRAAVEGLDGLQRYVVSTHTMALAPVVSDLLAAPASKLEQIESKIQEIDENLGSLEGLRIALPRRLAEEGRDNPNKSTVRRLLAALEALGDAEKRPEAEGARGPSPEAILSERDDLHKEVRKVTGRPVEGYYALLLLDGDRMGAWLSSAAGRAEAVGRPPFGELWHSGVAKEVRQELTGIERYLDAPAPPSPGYHAALSSALGSLSAEVFPALVEEG
ncbi:MAG: type III-B CRISPR-associated protein Cas10/Cmr2, partial [Myxococcota bacterium]